MEPFFLIKDMKRVNDEIIEGHIDKKQKPQDSIYHQLLNENDAKEIISLTKKDGFFNDNKSSIYKNMINYTNQVLVYNSTIYQTLKINNVKITPCITNQNYLIKLLNANYLLQNKSLKITKEEFSKFKIIFLGIFLISKQKTTNNLILNYLKWSLIPESFKLQNHSNDDFYLIDHIFLKINSLLDKFIPIKEEKEEVIKDIEPFRFSDMEKINNQEFRSRKAQILKKEPPKELTIIRPMESKKDNTRLKQQQLLQKHYYFNEKNLEHINNLLTLNDLQCIFAYHGVIYYAKKIIDTPYFKNYMKLVNLGKYSAEYLKNLDIEQRENSQSDFNKGMRFLKGLDFLKKQETSLFPFLLTMKDGSDVSVNLPISSYYMG